MYQTEPASETTWNIGAIVNKVMLIDKNSVLDPIVRVPKPGELSKLEGLPTRCSLVSSSGENVDNVLPRPSGDPPRPPHLDQGPGSSPKVAPRLMNKTLPRNLLMSRYEWRPPTNVPPFRK